MKMCVSLSNSMCPMEIKQMDCTNKTVNYKQNKLLLEGFNSIFIILTVTILIYKDYLTLNL